MAILGKHNLILIALVFLTRSFGCTPAMSDECEKFFSVPGSQRRNVLLSYPLEKQLRIYRCGMNRRPPDRYLSEYIADNGQEAIPALLQILETETDELYQYMIVDIFEVISIRGHLRERPDVVSRIQKVVNAMKISTFRDMAQESLKKIETNNSAG